jgi:hypothetical protein
VLPGKTEEATSSVPNSQPVATNNFFAPFRALPMQNAEMRSEENPTKTSGRNESPGSVLTSEANLINLLRELKRVITG